MKAAQEATELTRYIMDEIDQGIIGLDEGLVIRLWNRWLYIRTGLKEEHTVGKSLKDVFPLIPEETLGYISQALETGLPMVLSPALRRQKFLPIAVNHQYLKMLPAGWEGFEGILLFIQDLTPQVTYEEQLKESYRALMEAALDHVFLLDTEARFMVSNDKVAYLGLEKGSQLLGMAFKDAIEGFICTGLKEALEGLTAGQEIARIELRRKDTKGKEHYYEVTLYPVIRDQTLWALGGNVRDVTEKRLMESMLRQSQKMEALGTLAGGVAHDFNNILSAIIGYTELSLGKVPKGEKIYSYLEGILKAAKRAEVLISQILTFSRKGREELKAINPVPFSKEVTKMLRASIPSEIQIVVQIPEIQCQVMSSPSYLHQILLNLCTNAAHAMEGEGVLTVSVEPVELDQDALRQIHPYPPPQPGAYVRLRVMDTGRGIPLGILEHIFDPYFTTKPEGKGTGLGLSVVWGIVKQCQGGIGVFTSPGKGSTFDVYLPRLDGQEDMAFSEKGPLEEVPTGEESILLVDDEPSIRDCGTQMLMRLGYRVSACSNGQEALKLFGSEPGAFALVITDVSMPKMSGIRLAGEIRKIDPKVPILLCTGHGKDSYEDQVRELRLQGVLSKPFMLQTLALAVREAIEGRETGNK